MSLTSNISQISVPSQPSQAKDSALTEKTTQAPTFTTLPLETRLQIYNYILGPVKHTLRRQAECSPRTEVKLFDTSLLAVNKQVNAETVPLFYANHTFHYDASRRSSIPSHNLMWLKHASIDISTQAFRPVDIVLATQIQELDKCCPALRTLTVHFIKMHIDGSYASIVVQLTPHGHTARALQTLHPRLDRLNMVVYGKCYCLHIFRQSVITDGSPWVEEILDKWPLISLSSAPHARQTLPPPGPLICWASIWERMPHEIYAYHLFGPKIAKKLQEGEVEKKEWFFAR